MKTTVKEEGSRPLHLWTRDIEEGAIHQLRNTAKMPFLHSHGVAAMPDTHWGIGATVGSVIATSRAIIPAAVGKDIGCGMNAVRTNLKAENLPDDLQALHDLIERTIPLSSTEGHNRDDPGSYVPLSIRDGLYAVTFAHPKVGRDKLIHRAFNQFGTLGTGNHFIEICLDESNQVWVMLHSGSRGIGNVIGGYFIEKAREKARQWFINLPDEDLAFLPENTEEFQDYVHAVRWAQNYALENRRVMMNEVTRCLQSLVGPLVIVDEAVNCHHNYVEIENHYGKNVYVTRKGAIRAREGDLGIIPGSMGERSYIVRGKGNPESYHSCSHGAGRTMGRKDAERKFKVEDLIAQTKGVVCRKDKGVLDEIPAAYKNIDEVMENQKDLVDIVHTLKQVVCVKG